MIKVYIASPYTKGDIAINVKLSIEIRRRKHGADGEIKLAQENGLPVFYSIDELNKFYNG